MVSIWMHFNIRGVTLIKYIFIHIIVEKISPSITNLTILKTFITKFASFFVTRVNNSISLQMDPVPMYVFDVKSEPESKSIKIDQNSKWWGPGFNSFVTLKCNVSKGSMCQNFERFNFVAAFIKSGLK